MHDIIFFCLILHWKALSVFESTRTSFPKLSKSCRHQSLLLVTDPDIELFRDVFTDCQKTFVKIMSAKEILAQYFRQNMGLITFGIP